MPLSAPVTANAVERSAGALGRVAVASMQGMRNNHEDAHCVDHDLGVVAVFDGHVGDEAAAFASERLPLHLKARKNSSPKLALPATYLACEEEMNANLPKNCDAGTTATLAWVQQKSSVIHIHVANCGDSRAFLWHRATGSIVSTKDHRPDDKDERKRIEAAGGTVCDDFDPPRVDGSLACSRALGSFKYKTGSDDAAAKKVSCVPDIYEWEARAGDVLILGCDGVFDVLSNEQLVKEVCNREDGSELGATLVKTLELLIKKESDDNMTLLVVELGSIGFEEHHVAVAAGDFLKIKDAEVLDQYIAFCKRYGYELKKEMVPKAPPRAALVSLGPVPKRYGGLPYPAVVGANVETNGVSLPYTRTKPEDQSETPEQLEHQIYKLRDLRHALPKHDLSRDCLSTRIGNLRWERKVAMAQNGHDFPRCKQGGLESGDLGSLAPPFLGESLGIAWDEKPVCWEETKLEELFWDWLSLPESQTIAQEILRQAKSENSGTNFSSFSSLSSPSRKPLVSPRSPTRRVDKSLAAAVSSPKSSPTAKSPCLSSTPSKLSSGTSLQKGLEAAATAGIPRFCFPRRTQPEPTLSSEVQRQIHEWFVGEEILAITQYEQIETLCVDVFGLSNYFAGALFHKIKAFHKISSSDLKSTDMQKPNLTPSSVPITEQMIVSWCHGRIQLDDPELTFFSIVKQDDQDFISSADLKFFFWMVLIAHPGLDFLRDSGEFQARYAETCIARIFYVYDRKNAKRIYLNDLRRHTPSVVTAWRKLAEQDDINDDRDFFSYEHFYVMYCTFCELDSDHDFLLDKDDLLKYDGNALSRLATTHIFNEAGPKFFSGVKGKMNYEDWIYFLLNDRARTTDRSIMSWFQLIDLDCDGCIREQEMKYFWKEQAQRVECSNKETILFADVMCQMNDMMTPAVEGEFRLSDFKRKPKFAGIFFAVFLNLNQFLDWEYQDAHDKVDPNKTDWDRWCESEYQRLVLEDER